MNLLSTPEFKVGVLVVVVSAMIGVMSLKVAEGPGGFLRGERSYWFTIDNASGLIKSGAVKMAGIKVGIIEDIVLVDGKAKIKVRVQDKARVTPSTKVILKSDGILGDRHVELTPGLDSEGRLEGGSEIVDKVERGNLSDVMVEVSKISKSLNTLAETLNKATQGDGDEGSPVGRIVLNLEAISKDIRDVTGRNKQKLNDIVDRVHNLTKNLDTYVNEQTLARVDAAVKNIEEITDKVNRGEGTLGRLINDDQTVEELNTAIAGVNKFLGGADKLETSFDFHSEYLTGVDLTKSFLGIKIQPGLDRYYEFGIIDDPRGVVKSIRTETQPVNPPGGPTTVDTTTTYKNKVKITALFAKNFYDFTVKGGLIENAGGVGFDYHLFNRKLRLSAEFFDFSDLYIRAFVRYNFLHGVYVVAGGDNLAEAKGDVASGFFGAGIFITNDDLKLLASKVSFK
jgi:phospholipid/cholesterol/gamma-HCH transport system substrate-binding protein